MSKRYSELYVIFFDKLNTFLSIMCFHTDLIMHNICYGIRNVHLIKLNFNSMKRSNWILGFFIAAFSVSAVVSCKNKKAESTTQENKNNENNNSVEISSDATLRSSVNDVVKAYNGVEADVKDGVVTLRGNIRQADLQPLIMKVQELKPKKVDNQLVIKS